MPSLSEISALQKNGPDGHSIWDQLTNLIEPPRTEKKKKKGNKDNEKDKDKETKLSGQMQLAVHAPFLEKAIMSNFSNPLDAFSRFHSALVGGTVANAAWEWEDSTYNPGDLTIVDLNWVTNQHVFLEVKSNSTGTTVGQCQVWLGNAHISHHIESHNSESAEMQLPSVVGGDGKWSVPVYYHGVSVGNMSGIVSIEPHDYSPTKSNISSEGIYYTHIYIYMYIYIYILYIYITYLH